MQRNPRASSSLGFGFLVCYAATQLAHPLQQTRIQVVRSNKVARKRLTESNGTPAMDPGHMDIDLMYTFAYYFEEDIRIRRHTNKRGIDLNKTQMRHGRKLDSRSVSLLWTRFIGTGAVFAGKRFCDTNCCGGGSHRIDGTHAALSVGSELACSLFQKRDVCSLYSPSCSAYYGAGSSPPALRSSAQFAVQEAECGTVRHFFSDAWCARSAVQHADERWRSRPAL